MMGTSANDPYVHCTICGEQEFEIAPIYMVVSALVFDEAPIKDVRRIVCAGCYAVHEVNRMGVIRLAS